MPSRWTPAPPTSPMAARAFRNDNLGGGRAVAAATVGGPPSGAETTGLYVPEDGLRQLGLADGVAVNVRAGGTEVRAVVRVGPDGPLWRPGAALARQLSLPPGLQLRARYDREAETLFLGPFIGVLALRVRRGPAFGDHDPFFQALTRQGARLGTPTFVFTPGDVRWEEGRIFGYVSTPTARGAVWRRQSFPMPDVIYDRVQTRRAEASPNYSVFRRRLKQKVGAWFNEAGFFDKWTFHEMAFRREGLQPYLPETRRFIDGDDLEQMVARHPVVFVKPVAGSLGVGIIKVTRLSPAGFAVQHQIGEATYTRRVRSTGALYRLVVRLSRGRPGIVQQGLPLARWNGRPFDVRILLQRGGDGEWAVTKIFSRIAARGSITSNLTRGAEACNIHLLLRAVYGRSQRGRMYRQLYGAGLYCAQEIAAALPGHVGELGLDLGLTRGGRIWLIEANSKPFLQMNREAGSRRTIALSVRRPVQYAMHLAGFSFGNAHSPTKERNR